jgi:hypothetical protein
MERRPLTQEDKNKKSEYDKKLYLQKREEKLKQVKEYNSTPERKSQKSIYDKANHNKEWRLNKKYGLTLEQYNQILINQNHKCMICRN